MLMMRAVAAAKKIRKKVAADDACRRPCQCEQSEAPDANDACGRCCAKLQPGQLMLMMRAVSPARGQLIRMLHASCPLTLESQMMLTMSTPAATADR